MLARAVCDTLLAALYVHVDDHAVAAQSQRPGRPKKQTDAELICLAVAQVLLGFHPWLQFQGISISRYAEIRFNKC
ncbi:hypothetical protein AB0E01_00235 [Nocardia vinacea]|uniref:hypothetical protein n=1 Tax=Nocardia vinacea TaxID=96468 RepID=UPI0033EE9A1D